MSFCESSGRIANSTRFRSTAAVFGVLMLSAMATTESWAQSTVVIGGSGQPAVEVNLDVLDRTEGQRPGAGRRLLMPGERPADVVRLRAPGSSVRSPSVASPPRLKLRRPATRPEARPVQQATRPMPASPTRMVTQRIVSAPTPTQPVARATPLAPPPRFAPTALPPVAKAPPPRTAAKVPPPPAAAPVAPALPKAPPARIVQPQPNPSPPSTQSRREERHVAALPRVSLPRDGGQVLRIDFLGASTRLTSDAKRSLGSLAATMEESDGRLQLKAYAGGTRETLSSARRLSLSRALSVRSFLIEQGIRSTRIDVRALGRAVDSGPPERVDIVLLTQ